MFPSSKIQKSIINEIIKSICDKNKSQKENIYSEIEILGSDYTNELFIRYNKTFFDENFEAQNQKKLIGIDTNGKIDYNVYLREFETLKDRIHFINSLFSVKI